MRRVPEPEADQDTGRWGLPRNPVDQPELAQPVQVGPPVVVLQDMPDPQIRSVPRTRLQLQCEPPGSGRFAARHVPSWLSTPPQISESERYRKLALFQSRDFSLRHVGSPPCVVCGVSQIVKCILPQSTPLGIETTNATLRSRLCQPKVHLTVDRSGRSKQRSKVQLLSGTQQLEMAESRVRTFVLLGARRVE